MMAADIGAKMMLGIFYNEVAKSLGVICELVYSEIENESFSFYLRYRTEFSE